MWVLVLVFSLLTVEAVPLRQRLDLENYEENLEDVTSSVLRGRLQMFAPDADDLSCLMRDSTNNEVYLTVDKCTYDTPAIFDLDPDQGILRSAGSDYTNMMWTYDNDASKEVAKGLGGRGDGRSFFTLQQITSSKWKWNVPTTDFQPILLTDIKGNTLCFSVTEMADKQYAEMRIVKDSTDQCTRFKLMVPSDDFVSGSIQYFDSLQAPGSTPNCVTYDPKALPPVSALYLAPCDATRTDQKYMLNMVTNHLRWATETAGNMNGPALFFWWSGPIKSYPDFDEKTKGYGWKFSLLSASSVIVLDDRGYTGYCWTVVQDANGRRSITANQTCGAFALFPDHENFFVKRLATPPRVTTTVVFQVSGKDGCFETKRNTEHFHAADGSVNNNRVFKLAVGSCNFDHYELSRRFVITQKVGATCTSSGCPGLVRWVGDYEHVLFIPKLPDGNGPFKAQYPIVSSGLDENSIPYEFDFPMNKDGPIRIKLPDGTNACIARGDDKYVYVTSDVSQCLTVRAFVATQTGPDNDDPAISTLVRFDYTSAVIWPKGPEAEGMSESDKNDLREQARTDRDAQDKFFRLFDMFYADLGVSGRRRFRRQGLGLRLAATGDLVANTKPGHKNGLQFGFLQAADQLKQNRYYLISITLTVNDLNPSRTHMLMNFARSSGCVVYITGGGHLGMRCSSEGQDLFTAQVQEWADPSFSLQGTHKIAMLFSTQAGDPIRLYVNGVPVLTVTNPASWEIMHSAVYIRLFTDFHLWQYHPLSATLSRFSLVVSNDLGKLDAVAKRNVLSNSKKLKFGGFKGDPSAVVPVYSLQTSWNKCHSIKNSTTGFVDGVSCILAVSKDGHPVTVPRDVFNLACSRPHCKIGFADDAPATGSAFKFNYFSNYPDQFHSEDVGNPDLFSDASFITDGWVTQPVSFGLKYQQASASLLELDESLEVADNVRYQCRESTCQGIGNRHFDDNSQGDTF